MIRLTRSLRRLAEGQRILGQAPNTASPARGQAQGRQAAERGFAAQSSLAELTPSSAHGYDYLGPYHRRKRTAPRHRAQPQSIPSAHEWFCHLLIVEAQCRGPHRGSQALDLDPSPRSITPCWRNLLFRREYEPPSTKRSWSSDSIPIFCWPVLARLRPIVRRKCILRPSKPFSALASSRGKSRDAHGLWPHPGPWPEMLARPERSLRSCSNSRAHVSVPNLYPAAIHVA